MIVSNWFTGAFMLSCILLHTITEVKTQTPSIQLPVELVGFPVIILAVRLSNFVKKLAYSLNPNTYISRNKRSLSFNDDMIDMVEAEKRLVNELGENVCIYARVCLHHAEKARKSVGRANYNVDWDEVFSHYKTTSDKNKEFYLLSVFLGDFIASPKFCNQLAKRGRVLHEELVSIAIRESIPKTTYTTELKCLQLFWIPVIPEVAVNLVILNETPIKISILQNGLNTLYNVFERSNPTLYGLGFYNAFVDHKNSHALTQL